MSAAVQSSIVFAVVAIAASYATLKFMPAAWRRSLAARAAAWVQRSGASEVMARRVEAKLASGGACGSCDTCKACATSAATLQGLEPGAPPLRQIPIRRVS